MLNQTLPGGISPFETNILGKAFLMFHIVKGQVVADYDLIYFKNGLLFSGTEKTRAIGRTSRNEKVLHFKIGKKFKRYTFLNITANY